MNLKKIGKAFLCRLLEAQVKRLRKKYNFKVVAVVGSVGKTSTKLAIAKMLSTKTRVVYQDGNYNDRLTVPLILFNQVEPNIFNIFAWLKILRQNSKQIKRGYPYDIAIVELGPDGPGQLKYFKYLKPEICVLTAIAAEHMEFFKTLDNVAAEELVPLSFSAQSLVNIDDVPEEYLAGYKYKSYGTAKKADCQLISSTAKTINGQHIKIELSEKKTAIGNIRLLGSQGAKVALAAAAVSDSLGWSIQDIQTGLANLSAVAGRMQVLDGANSSKLIDDTYNASPIAVKAALDVLFNLEATQRIAILGSMNELGSVSQSEHTAIGAYCDPKKLDLLVTIGSQAQKYLAPAASDNGCQVTSFNNPYQAGTYVLNLLKPGTIVMAKGSQNGVFAEEALKQLLKNKDDQSKLVRQSKYWLDIKDKQFNSLGTDSPVT